ncbi:BatD family protein [Rubritalea marina]|uniref:BatD family protein n=1 Tax=Rubritalea marina TaxID=361055 RepID=UPI000369BC56|nr:BatD family protein [Rubritalea marina]
MRTLLPILSLAIAMCAACVHAETPRPELLQKSLFIHQPVRATLSFNKIIDEPTNLTNLGDHLQLLDYQLETKPKAPQIKSILHLRFIPHKAGNLTFPALQFRSGQSTLTSQASTFNVDAPQQVDKMALNIVPSKTKVYVGEPLRVDLTWMSSVHAGAFQNLRLNPSFFHDEGIKVAIPRNTAEEDQQIGLPIGGRRVIATRQKIAGNEKALGTVSLPLYLKFERAGTHTLPRTRLEVAKLAKPKAMFGHYAAHFNNSFFTTPPDEAQFQEWWIESQALEIEVLPLPELPADQTFSGLFLPLEVSQNIEPKQSKIGDLLTHTTQLNTPVPQSLIDMPSLRQSADFDERFIIDSTRSSTWNPQHTTYQNRMRILTPSVQQIPPIQLIVFDSDAGAYATLSSASISLNVSPLEDASTLPLSQFQSPTTLQTQPDGIWSNHQANTMQDFIQSLIVCLSENLSSMLLIGAIAMISLWPVVQLRRRLKLDPAFQASRKAMLSLKRSKPGTPEQAAAFIQWIAVQHHAKPGAWTSADSIKCLQHAKVNQQDIDQVIATHKTLDQQAYASAKSPAQLPNLLPIAKRISKAMAGVTTLCIIITAIIFSPRANASSPWSKAEQRFAQAQQLSPESKQQFAEAALCYEAAADLGHLPGKSYYNAGNAWFHAGELGRSIAAFRSASYYLPLDSQVTDNLASARSLVAIHTGAHSGQALLKIPRIWLRSALSLCSTFLWISLLTYLYLRSPRSRKICVMTLCIFAVLAGLTIHSETKHQNAAVVIVDHAIAKKGPSHRFANAFQVPLSDGVECAILETNNAWTHIQLPNNKHAWVPTAQLQQIDR